MTIMLSRLVLAGESQAATVFRQPQCSGSHSVQAATVFSHRKCGDITPITYVEALDETLTLSAVYLSLQPCKVKYHSPIFASRQSRTFDWLRTETKCGGGSAEVGNAPMRTGSRSPQ
jgi:hypothetical protein